MKVKLSKIILRLVIVFGLSPAAVSANEGNILNLFCPSKRSDTSTFYYIAHIDGSRAEVIAGDKLFSYPPFELSYTANARSYSYDVQSYNAALQADAARLRRSYNKATRVSLSRTSGELMVTQNYSMIGKLSAWYTCRQVSSEEFRQAKERAIKSYGDYRAKIDAERRQKEDEVIGRQKF